MKRIPLDELESFIKKVRIKSLPYAVRQTLNDLAWETRRVSQGNISSQMILRNQWTTKSIRVKPARSLVLRNMQSEIGSTEDYMRKQEHGDTERPTPASRGLALPTSAAAGQYGAKPRTVLVRRSNRIENIKLTRRRPRGASAKQRLIIAVAVAVRDKHRYLFLDRADYGVRRGIYRVVGGRYKGRHWPRGARLNMIADLSHSSARVPSRPWLGPAIKQSGTRIPDYYHKALMYQLRRL